MKKLFIVLGVILLIYFDARLLIPPYIEGLRNQVKSPALNSVSAEAQVMYARLDFVSDLHGDALL